jgi:peptide/nickel transport system ATP-binding protein
MRSGKIVEAGAVETVFRSPTHPYTKELIEAVPHLPTRATERAI